MANIGKIKARRNEKNHSHYVDDNDANDNNNDSVDDNNYIFKKN